MIVLLIIVSYLITGSHGLISRNLKERARDFNIILDDVSIKHLAFGKEYTAAVEAKQVAQQEAERAAEQDQVNLDVRKYGYEQPQPDTQSFILEISSTWLIIANGAIMLLLLVNISFLSYYNCCWQSKTMERKIESIV